VLELFEARQIEGELVGVENAGFLLLVESHRFLIVEIAVPDIECATGFGVGDLLAATLEDDLDGVVFLVVHHGECVVTTDAGDFPDGDFGIKLQRRTGLHFR
jgi:hypothetical protein